MVASMFAAAGRIHGKMSGAQITQKASIDSAKLQAISLIISRMGSKLAQDIEEGMEMRY